MRYEREVDFENYIRLIKSSTIDEALDGYVNVLECKPHFHEAREFLFVTENELEIVCNGQHCRLSAGDIHYCDSFEPHLYKESKAEGYVLLISGSYFSFFNSVYKKKKLHALLTNKEFNQRLFEIVVRWYESGTDDLLKNVGYLYDLLSKIVTEYGVEEIVENRQDGLIKKMLEFVEENFLTDITLADVAQHIYCNMSYVSRIWNNYVGESFREYLNRRRVYYAQTLFDDSGEKANVMTIALNSGFNSKNTFYRAYKRVFGHTPTEEKSKKTRQ